MFHRIRILAHLIPLIALLLASRPLAAQRGGSSAAAAPFAASLASKLNADGTLDADGGFNGTLDAAGWRMAIGSDGRPRFFADTADALWDDRFLASSGVNAQVSAIAVHDGKLYIGGRFGAAGDMPVNSIAMWDGAAWHAFGDGITISGYPATVAAIVFDGNDMYVGGRFDKAGSLNVNDIARWDGAAWHALGDGIQGGDAIQGDVNVLALQGDYLYAGGVFTKAGKISANGIARWNKTTGVWEALPGGALVGNGVAVNAIAPLPDGSRLYVGGLFDSAGAVEASNIALWNGTSWQALRLGLNAPVGKLLLHGSDLYVAGGFLLADERDALHVARWDGTAWSTVPGMLAHPTVSTAVTGMGTAPNGDIWVSSISIDDSASSGYRSDITRYDNASRQWSIVDTSIDAGIRHNVIDAGRLYVAGSFGMIGGAITSNVAWRDLASAGWQGFENVKGNAPDGEVRAVAVRGHEVYVGGTFSHVGGIRANGIAMWRSDSNTWSNLGNVLQSGAAVNAIVIEGEDVFVGGGFIIDGVNGRAGNLGRWNAGKWWAISGAGGGQIWALATGAGNLFVGGSFYTLNFVEVGYTARWHIYIQEWRTLGQGVDGPVHAIAVAPNGNDIYFGGSFTRAGTVAAKGIAKWDMTDTVWTAVGGDIVNDTMPGDVDVLRFDGSTLYAGGQFTRAGGVPVTSIAQWNGSAWSGMGGGITDGSRITSITTAPDGALFVGGSFRSIGGTPANNLAQWDTARKVWSAVGSGADSTVMAVATAGNDLFAGGSFAHAGGRKSFHLGRWGGLPTPPASVGHGRADVSAAIALTISPNPFRTTAELRFTLPEAGPVRLTVFNSLGAEVAVLADGMMSAGKHRVAWTPTGMPHGAYYCRLWSRGGTSVVEGEF